jgi:dTDP-D-glucose 4,6-dehydratase
MQTEPFVGTTVLVTGGVGFIGNNPLRHSTLDEFSDIFIVDKLC